MIVGQTFFSVRKGTEHRAEKALSELDGLLDKTSGLTARRLLRSFAMSPLASALHDEEREAALGDVHYVVQTEWDTIEAHDVFFRSPGLQRVYAVLTSILTSGPYEVLYEESVEWRDRSHAIV